MNLAVRLAYYFKPSTIVTSTRKFFKHLALYKFTDFKEDIYIIQNGNESENNYKVQSLVLSLELYYIFTLNSTRAPIVELTEEAKASITKANSTPVYIYDNGKLVYICPSAAQLKRETGINRSTIGVATANPNHLVYD